MGFRAYNLRVSVRARDKNMHTISRPPDREDSIVRSGFAGDLWQTQAEVVGMVSMIEMFCASSLKVGDSVVW